MNTYSSTLVELNNKNQELKTKLYDLEAVIGHKLATEDKTETEAELKTEFSNVKQNLDKKLAERDTLREIENNIDETEKEIATEKKIIQENEKNIENLLLELGKNLYENYNSDLASVFGVQHEEISQEINTLEDLNNQKENLKLEMEKQGFFSKLMTQTKIAGLNIAISSHTKKKEDTLKKGAKLCLDNEVVTQENGGEVFYNSVNLKNAIDTSNKRIILLTEDLAKSKEKLGKMEKDSKLKHEIEDLMLDLDNIANKIGHAFGKLYVTRDAEILMEFPKDYEEDLTSVLELKKELKFVHRDIEIVELSKEIEATEKSIKNMNEEITSNKEKIEELKEKNKKITKLLGDAEKSKDNLVTKKTALEAEVEKDKE